MAQGEEYDRGTLVRVVAYEGDYRRVEFGGAVLDALAFREGGGQPVAEGEKVGNPGGKPAVLDGVVGRVAGHLLGVVNLAESRQDKRDLRPHIRAFQRPVRHLGR